MTTYEPAIPVGIRGGVLVRAVDLPKEEKGLACRCACPHCHKPLIAHLKGVGKRPHFKHSAVTEYCGKALESAAHLFAKDVLSRAGHIRLPHIFVDGYMARDEEVFQFHEVLVETPIDGIIPDIILIGKQGKVLVEIVVSNSPSEKKMHIVKELDLAVLLIHIDYSMAWKFDEVELENAIIDHTENKQWANHPYVEAWRKEQKRKDEEQRHKDQEQRRKAEEARCEVERRRLAAIKNECCPAHQRAMRSMWAKELYSDPTWIGISRGLGLSPGQIPAYLNTPIEGDFIFSSDRRLWQAFIFRQVVYFGRKPFDCADFNMKLLVDYVKDYSKLPLNRILLKAYQVSGNGVRSLTEVLGSYCLVLEEYGFLERDSSNGQHPYGWRFAKVPWLQRELCGKSLPTRLEIPKLEYYVVHHPDKGFWSIQNTHGLANCIVFPLYNLSDANKIAASMNSVEASRH